MCRSDYINEFIQEADMTERERFIRTVTFDNPDRVPLTCGGGRESTLRRWHSEGLPEGEAPQRYVMKELGIELPPPHEDSGFFVNSRMIPTFEEKVLKHANGHYIVRDWMGAITEISDQYDYTYIRNAIDFVTRKWHRFPVTGRAEWESMKQRYDPMAQGRIPEDIQALGGRLKNRDYTISIDINGPFWQLREWMGMEELCIAFLDRPELVAEMIDFWADFVEKLLERVLPYVDVDHLHLHEDMAYKAHSMLSPKMTCQYLQPVYERWGALAKKYGVPVYSMDSDGFIEELIPIWIDSGMILCDPIEVAAGNDIVHFRQSFGKSMAYQGGIDKRAIAAGGDILEREIKRVLPPLLKDGGYIPACDHGIPGDVSFDNYRHYIKLVAQETGWL